MESHEPAADSTPRSKVSGSIRNLESSKTVSLPEKVLPSIEYYKLNVGPGSYNNTSTSSTFKAIPTFTFRSRSILKMPDAADPTNPGAGQYDPQVTSDQLKKNVTMGSGPKCPSTNFELPSVSPGPIYSYAAPKAMEKTLHKFRSVKLVH